MSQVQTKHLWRCNGPGCGTEVWLDHGEWAEADLPKGWYAVMGWDIQCCSVKCRNAFVKARESAGEKPYLWCDRGVDGGRGRLMPHRPEPQESPRKPIHVGKLVEVGNIRGKTLVRLEVDKVVAMALAPSLYRTVLLCPEEP